MSDLATYDDFEMDGLTPTTPPAKRRKVQAVRPSPPRLSELLAAFGAKSTPISVTNMRRASCGRDLREKPVISYAESQSSPSTLSPGSMTSFNEDVLSSRTSVMSGEESEDELQADDVIHAVPRKTATKVLPPRSTRSKVSYASPVKTKKKSETKKRKSNKILISDTGIQRPFTKVNTDTQRSKIRQEIAQFTKPKRDAFILANKDYFMPVLPETSYVDKLERVHAMAEEDEPPQLIAYEALAKQPKGVKAIMKPYQLEGLSFLVYMYRNGMSCILGDEMGLGKTLQTLSMFQWLAENKVAAAENRPHLVVCPMSVLSSWMNEARKWVPELNVIRFHGPKSERERLKKDILSGNALSRQTRGAGGGVGHTGFIDVIVTTYDTFKADKGWFQRAFAWRYCVLDEGHKIKNEKTEMSSALQTIQAEHRLLLTGTPLQNNLREMWALLHWLYPELFSVDTADLFRQAFDLTMGKVSTQFMDGARTLLELVMLRRMKASPGVNLGLPSKTEILLYVPLTPMQRFWYTRLLTKTDNAMLDDLFKDAKDKEAHAAVNHTSDMSALGDPESTTVALGDDAWAESKQIMQQALAHEQQSTEKTGHWTKLMNLIMQLRKVCAHPYMLPHAEPEPFTLGDHVIKASGKFIVLAKLIEELVMKRGKKILVFAGLTKTLDLCEDLLAVKGANAPKAPFRYVRFDGGTSRASRNLGIRMFNDPNSDYKVMLIATRAGGLGVNLASASDVVFMDEDWNPQITLQAEARAHRIGQTQPVTVYKICTQGTVEEQMMGRIRKKLYLSTKITESMRNIHGAPGATSKKRKRTNEAEGEDDTPNLGTDQLKSLLRKGARTLAHPEVDVTAMLGWDFETMIRQCKDKTDDATIASDAIKEVTEEDEQSWLNTMERVETAVFEGKRHHKQLDQAVKENPDLDRADRRVGKNTTVMIDGFAINKESLQCADWEAVPTMAGKDARLAEPVREKKAPIVNQDHCQHCWDGGEVVLCSGCPRSYHNKCLDSHFKLKAKGKMNFYCPQHRCVECEANTTDAGGMIFRCRWCVNGYCEDCLDWDNVKLLGETLPEFEMLGFGANAQAWYIECPACVENWKIDDEAKTDVDQERVRIEKEYGKFLKARVA